MRPRLLSAYGPFLSAASAAIALACLAPAASSRIVPDSTVLARVGPRTVTAGVFVDNWVAGNALTRPAQGDSAGRRQFLDILVNRELMRLAALERPEEFDFGERLKIAQWREELLKNALYVKLVADSAVITDDDIRHMHTIKSTFLHVRRITCRTEQECAGIRARLVRGEPWSQLVKLSVDTSSVRRNGDIGLQGYLHFRPHVAQEVYKVKDGGLSTVIFDRGFWHLYYVDSRVTMQTEPVEKQYRSLREEVRRIKEPEVMARHEERFAFDRKVKYEAANVAFAVREFGEKAHVRFTATGPELDLDARPEFAPQDTGRVLATSLEGTYTLGAFLNDYLALPALSRPTIQGPEDLLHAINRFLFQPYLLQLAIQMGMENSDFYRQEMQRLKENVLIEHLYADSVEKRVRVTPQDRRRYYAKNKNQFFTYTREHLFAFYRPSREWAEGLADSLRQRLVDPGEVARRDSLLHPDQLWAEERVTWSNGPNDLRTMFNEMKDGEVRLVPGERVSMVVLRVEQIPGHQLALQEVESIIDESLRNQQAEDLLNAMLRRLRKRYPVKLHTEDLMDLDLTLI
jgi:hypothetical protein